MKYLLIAGIILTLTSLIQRAHCAEAGWDRVIENMDITQTIRLTSSDWDNTLIRNCTIHDTGIGNDGIFMRDVRNVRIENCEIYNIDGHGGIRMSVSGSGTDRIQIINNTIHDVAGNGINAPQRSQSAPSVSQSNLEISGNTLYNTGLGSSSGLTHAIYCQAPDALIKNNRIYGARDGNGISVRSSGIVSGNMVSGLSKANKPAIRYYSDHMKGPSNTLTIENNIVYNNASLAHCIDITEHADLYENSNGDDHIVKFFNIRFNTAISFQSNRNAIYVSDHYSHSSYSVLVDGNIAINTHSQHNAISLPAAVTGEGNYISANLDGFVSSIDPYNFHLQQNHSAVNFATGLTNNFPAMDYDGDPRTSAFLDAGADQTNQHPNQAGLRYTDFMSIHFTAVEQSDLQISGEAVTELSYPDWFSLSF